MPTSDARTLLLERIRSSPPKFVHIVGVPHSAERESEIDSLKIDHVWITLEAPPIGRVRAAVNTMSRLNRDGGFDSRVRVGVIRSTWANPPVPGLTEVDGYDYRILEARHNVFYEHFENEELADFLIRKARRAIMVAIWGELYARRQIGVHQIHSRRASRAVPLDLENRDGALKFYFNEEQSVELLLFKFCGQL